jgi:hypothetical protein
MDNSANRVEEPPVEPSNLDAVRTQDLDDMDFRNFALTIGVRLETKEQDECWLALDQQDWMILYRLLTEKRFSVPDKNAIHDTNNPDVHGSAADASNSLMLLSKVAKAAVDWYERTGTQSRE